MTSDSLRDDLAECFQDAVEMNNALTRPVETDEVMKGNKFIGVIRLSTAASIGFVFRQHETRREILGIPIYCLGDDKLSPPELIALIQSSLEQKLGDKIPKATILRIQKFLQSLILQSDDKIREEAKKADIVTTLREFSPLYGMSAIHFDSIARILSEDEKLSTDMRTNLNIFNRKPKVQHA